MKGKCTLHKELVVKIQVKGVIFMFGSISDFLLLGNLYHAEEQLERHQMTGELINYQRFSVEEVKTIVDYSFEDMKQLPKKKSYYLEDKK